MTSAQLHGVNLTGWLALESWVTPELFAGHGALTEGDLIASMTQEDYAALIEHHRETFITEQDIKQIAARGFNAIRLAVPWYCFGADGPHPGAYQGCISYVDKALEWAEEYGIKIIFTLAVNLDKQVSTRARELDVESPRLVRSRALDVLEALAQRYALRTGFLGIEVADVVRVARHRGLRVTEGVPAHMLRNYYREAYERIRAAAGDEPIIVLPDGGMSRGWNRFMAQRRYHNVWLDCHMDTISRRTRGSGPTSIPASLETQRAYLDEVLSGNLPVIVGSWSSSLAISEASLTPEGRIAVERLFTAQQLDMFERCCGWFFQTWKTSGFLSGWDARVAFATFERGML